jgi:hypothetical protein
MRLMSNNIWKLSTLGITGLFVATVAYNRVQPAAADSNEAVPYDACGDQAHMESALEHLRVARHELHLATANKGGHREEALGRTQEAINQVKKGCKFADDHRDNE